MPISGEWTLRQPQREQLQGSTGYIFQLLKSNALSWSRCLKGTRGPCCQDGYSYNDRRMLSLAKNRHVSHYPPIPHSMQTVAFPEYASTPRRKSLEEIPLAHGPAAGRRDEEDGSGGDAAREHRVDHAGLEALGAGLDDDRRVRGALDGGRRAGERDSGVPAGRRAGRVGSAGALKFSRQRVRPGAVPAGNLR